MLIHRWSRPGRTGESRTGESRTGHKADDQGAKAGLPGRQAERFGVGPAVVLGEHFAEAAWPVRDGTVANLAARDWKTGNGHRKAAGI